MSIETQLAIKRNAEEFSSYLKDLNSWTNEIKKKDILAKKTKIKKNNYPPIRSIGKIDSNSPPSSRPSSPIPESIPEKVGKPFKNEVKKERIKSYDYRSWDKYNVEEELERLENEDYKEPKPMVEEKDDDEINQQTIELSLIEKEKGNVMFKKGNYKRAIQYYTKSKELDPTNPVFPLNRAMAYLKLKKYSEAENDCTDCLALAPKNVKALYRRGLSRVGLKKYLEAKNDFEAAVVLEPSNKQAKDELNKVIAILKPKPKEESKLSAPINKNTNTSTTSTTTPKTSQLKKKKSTISKEQEEKLKNKPIRRRLQITEVGRTQEEIKKENEEELLKRMNKDIEEINEMMKNNDILNDKQRPISLTETNKEESFSSLDMVPVSTTKKENTKPKKQPKKMKIMEKGEENENKENIKEKEINEKKEKEKEKEMDKIEEKPKIELKTSSNKELEKETSIQEKRTESEIKPVKKIETKKSKDLLNTNNNALLSSFIFNKDDKEEKEIEQTQQQQQQQITEQKKTKLNKKRSVVIEEMDEIITEIKPLEPLNETILDNKENVKKEHQITTSPIEEENNNDNKNKPILQENKIEEIKEEKKNENEKKIDNSFKSSSPSPSPSPSRNIRSKVNVATTMYDFERDWKSMRNDDNKTFEYLSSIIPENLPNLFKNSLESDYLTRILIIMNKFYIEESMFNEMYALLNSLQKVNRFEMTLMFMSRKDKQVLKNIFDAMKSNQSSANFSITDLEALAKKYKMTL